MADDQSPPLQQTSTHKERTAPVQANVPGEKLFFFRPETGEIYVCDAGVSAEAVRAEAALLEGKLQTLSQCRETLSATLLRYENAQKTNQDPGAQAKVEEALKKEEKSKEDLLGEFKELSEANKGAELLELLPLASSKSGKPLFGGKKFTYVRSSKIKSHVRSYKLSEADKPEMKSFLVKGEDGKYKLDQKKLKEAFTTVKKKVNLAEKTEGLWLPETWSPGFVEGFNEKAHFGDPDDKDAPDKMIAFSGEAHLLRFFGGASLSRGSNISVDSFRNALAGQGELSAEYKLKGSIGIDLVDGKVDADWYIPKAGGIEAFLPSKQTLTLGHFRLHVKGGLSGSCGASVLGEGGVEFKLSRDGKKQVVKGSSSKRSAQSLTRPKLNVKAPEASGDAGAELTAFAGAQGEASIEGGLEWQQPEETEFAVFASIKPELTGQAGAGATACFHITYEREGKPPKLMFRLKAKLGACLGVGLKGEVLASVGAGEIIQFALWFKHQVVNALDQNLGYFEPATFVTFCRMCVLAIVEGKQLIDYIGAESDSMGDQIRDWTTTRRKEFVERLQKSSDQLVNSVAEVKGFLINRLNSIQDDIEKEEADLLDKIGQAVQIIQKAAYLQNELKNVFQFASADFTKLSPDQTASMVAWADSRTDVSVASLMAQKKTDATPGYKLAASDSFKYRLNRGTHPTWQRETMMAPDDTQFA